MHFTVLNICLIFLCAIRSIDAISWNPLKQQHSHQQQALTMSKSLNVFKKPLAVGRFRDAALASRAGR